MDQQIRCKVSRLLAQETWVPHTSDGRSNHQAYIAGGGIAGLASADYLIREVTPIYRGDHDIHVLLGALQVLLR